MDHVQPINSHLIGKPHEVSDTAQIENNAAPKPNFLNWIGIKKFVVNNLGNGGTKFLAGVLLIGGLAALPFIGPAAIPILAASGLLFGASTVKTLMDKKPDESAAELFCDSVFYYGLPATLALASPVLVTIAILLYLANWFYKPPSVSV